MKFIQCIVAIGFLLFSATAAAQYTATIDSLKKAEQDCLDSGRRMPGCVYEYYVQIDSLMNNVYNKLQMKSPANEKAILKKEQLMWLKQRDTFFEKQDKEYRDSIHSGDWGPEMRVIPLGEKTRFVEDRLWYLIKKLTGKRSAYS